MSGRVVQTTDTRKKKLERWFYLDMDKALDPDTDREEAIVVVPADRIERTKFGTEVVRDLSTTANECEHELFPLARIFDGPAVDDWMTAYLEHDAEQMSARLARWNTFRRTVLGNLTSYTVPVIVLRKETPREAVCTVFEKVNTGGVALDVFELLTATFASSQVRSAGGLGFAAEATRGTSRPPRATEHGLPASRDLVSDASPPAGLGCRRF